MSSRLLRTAPSWLLSLVLHAFLLCVLALMRLDPSSPNLGLLRLGADPSPVELQEFSIGADAQQPQEPIQPAQPTSPSSVVQWLSESASAIAPTLLEDAGQPAPPLEQLTNQIMPRTLLDGTLAQALSNQLSGRSSQDRQQLLNRYGGSADSERAVQLALAWLAKHQLRGGHKPGGWSFDHRLAGRGPTSEFGMLADATNAATAMALLPFLGAGHTHQQGQYRHVVTAGLSSLIASMSVNQSANYGSWLEPPVAWMYSHALATIAVSEAYALTQDQALKLPVQQAVNFLIYAQDPHGGGWRYEPRQPGDTSVVGWCIMGLKSAQMAGIGLPPHVTHQAGRFLDQAGNSDGTMYGYMAWSPSVDSQHRFDATTAIGLLCRMYSGWNKSHPSLQKGVQYLEQLGPQLDNLYYTYYATQVMRHYGSPHWENWNSRLRDALIAKQVKDGRDAGSWVPEGLDSREGGRLYQTALATMILEIYYRHLPLYGEGSTSGDDFEL
ncbi:MAG: hypothetical protein KF752_01465 [Pirellulaceae bacterium]|nr:hypothetical protein [Pirellulaceae bacterium]